MAFIVHRGKGVIRSLMRCYLFLVLVLAFSCSQSAELHSQEIQAGGPCEGCEAIYEYGGRTLHSVDTLPTFSTQKPRLKVYGTIFQKDGKTPASDCILYVYHTDRNGIYPAKTDSKGWGRRHGFIRGWIKTDKTGQYAFYTVRPGAYPGGAEVEHIHMTVKEPGVREYYIDDVIFTDDPLLTKRERNSRPDRAGSGIVTPERGNGLWTVRRDIVLGKNIPGYN